MHVCNVLSGVLQLRAVGGAGVGTRRHRELDPPSPSPLPPLAGAPSPRLPRSAISCATFGESSEARVHT